MRQSPFDQRRRVQAERAGGAIGWGMGGALGVALAAPDQRVVAVIGDGSAMLTVQALWTAAAYQIPVVYCICNNAGYRVLKLNLRRWFGDVLHEPDRPSQYIGMDLDQPFDLAAIAQAMGVPAERVEDPSSRRPRPNPGPPPQRPHPPRHHHRRQRVKTRPLLSLHLS